MPIKASNKLSDYTHITFGRIYGPEVSHELSRYTMLVAWHKFDRYERAALSEITRIDLSKLPFVTIATVANMLASARWSKYPYPVTSYRARIARAAIKHYNQSRKKKRKVVRLRLNPGI